MDVEVDEIHINSDTELSKELQKATLGDLVADTQEVAELIEGECGHSRVYELNKLHEQILRAAFDAICNAAKNEFEHLMLLGAVSTSLAMTFTSEIDRLALLAELEDFD